MHGSGRLAGEGARRWQSGQSQRGGAGCDRQTAFSVDEMTDPEGGWAAPQRGTQGTAGESAEPTRQERAVASQALALGTVAVAAGAIAESAVAAIVTLFDQTAEGCGAALHNGRHDGVLQGGEGLAGLGLEGLSAAAENVGDLESGAAHWRVGELLHNARLLRPPAMDPAPSGQGALSELLPEESASPNAPSNPPGPASLPLQRPYPISALPLISMYSAVRAM